jgi:hypothetical protein
VKRAALFAALFVLAGCGKSTGEGNSEAAIINQANSIENAADASVNAQIEALDAEANASFAALAPANISINSAEPAKKK